MDTALKDLSPQKGEQIQLSRNRLYSDSAVVSPEFQDIPIINMELYLKATTCQDLSKLSDDVRIECQKVAECFHKFGIIFIRDPRVDFEENENYIDLMEDYFEQTGDMFYKGMKVPDIIPECHY